MTIACPEGERESKSVITDIIKARTDDDYENIGTREVETCQSDVGKEQNPSTISATTPEVLNYFCSGRRRVMSANADILDSVNVKKLFQRIVIHSGH